jgi:sarcosine oxidase subunit beta
MSKFGVFDVVIIGAGSVGTPLAFFLAKSGVNTLVLDRLPSAGQGSNKAAIGGVRATHSDPAKIRLGLRSLEIFSHWEEEYGDDIEWHSGGYSFLAYGEKQESTLKNLLQRQKSYGLNIDWYDRQQILERIPALNCTDLLGGTISPEDGYCSNLKVNHAFYMGALLNGAQFNFGENVTEIRVKNGRLTNVVTDRGKYTAGVVINAAGAWAAAVGKLLGLEHPVRPDSHEAGITEPVAHFFDPMLIDIRPGPGSANVYFYQQKTGQVIFSMTPDPQVWGYDCCESSQFLPEMAQRMIQVVPRLANLRVRRTWRGLYPMTPDGFPIIGWSKEVQGYFMAIGMCGQGFMLGPGVGELVARIIYEGELGADDSMVLENLSPYRSYQGKEALK